MVWRNKKLDLGILEILVQRSELFAHTNVHLFLFAKSRFTKGCIDKAAELGNVTLVTYADILKRM